ncbi:Putative uncharacterized protein [Thermotoga neapolitana DSM 4359]|uniref:DUF1858 domain-containing protein n=1 Tax=Thermotoga neapolitana (strain ATCC 49049 / DSM 4359 / NBRC 107923 / NS-E) TaxID=309803 RepID=B9KBX9_THENN|nr:Putative uncharacterized protein [Thermotoga neapolitana DSM 4359]
MRKVIEKIREDTTLKEIMEAHERLERALRKYGFDTCCAKMESLKDACKKKGLDVEKVLEDLNRIVEEINEEERIIREIESQFL